MGSYVLPYGQMSLWGIFKCLKCLFNILYLYFSYLNDCTLTGNLFKITNGLEANDHMIMSLLLNTRPTSSKYKLRGEKRIGPHDITIYSIIFGSLLGDAYGEKRKGKGGTRISFYQEGSHLSYILWLHSLLSIRGYCNENLPKIQTRLGLKGVVRKTLRIHTWTYTSFNFFHDLFYWDGIKKVPKSIGNYLTPLALAIWIMDDGSKVKGGLKLSTNSFTYSDCLLLVTVLDDNFALKATVQSAGVPDQYHLYVWKESMPLLREIVSPYIIPEMRYKIIE